MIQLTPQNIRIGARAGSKNEAIRAAGQVLVESGFIEPGYIESMIGREGQANTYLGNGISIPHGMAKDRELIRATGISVVQLPEGVEWGPGKVAHLIVGIAAKSDEHLGVLAALTDVLDDPAKAELLAKTNDPNDIIAGLSREAAQPTPEPEGSSATARSAPRRCQDRGQRRNACTTGDCFRRSCRPVRVGYPRAIWHQDRERKIHGGHS